jgi:hypothetical protein
MDFTKEELHLILSSLLYTTEYGYTNMQDSEQEEYTAMNDLIDKVQEYQVFLRQIIY